jgi:hypothetical protein
MNELLTWMSARRSGSIQSFRTRVVALHPASAQGGGALAPHCLAAWTLSKLGHAEFEKSAGGKGWRVAPPVLAADDVYGSPCAVLCGARSAELLATLTDCGGPGRLRVSSQSSSPDLIELRAESPSILADTAHSAGIPLLWNASLALLAVCPHVKDMALEESSIPVGAGWTVSRFSKSGLAWVMGAAAEAQSVRTALFRFRGDYGTTYVLKEGGRAFSCDPAVGKFRIFTRRHRPIAYNAAAQELTIAAGCRPPEIIERALVVASGRLPAFRDRTLVYTHVGRATAECVAALLTQRLGGT